MDLRYLTIVHRQPSRRVCVWPESEAVYSINPIHIPFYNFLTSELPFFCTLLRYVVYIFPSNGILEVFLVTCFKFLGLGILKRDERLADRFKVEVNVILASANGRTRRYRPVTKGAGIYKLNDEIGHGEPSLKVPL